MDIKLRYNTTCTDNKLYWRVLINGIEHLASDVKIHVPVQTTQDVIEGVGLKHHISCKGENLVWNESELSIF